MDYYLNEISLTPVADQTSAREMMATFVKLCSTLRGWGFGSLRLSRDHEIKQFAICESYCVYDWFKDETVDIDLRRRFRSIATQAPLVPDSEPTLLEKQALSEFSLPNIQGPVFGLGIAFLTGSLAVSLRSRLIWNNAFFDLVRYFLEANGDAREERVNVRHAAGLEHLDQHLDWLKELNSDKNWKPTDNYFPQQTFVDALAEKYGGWVGYYSHCKNMSETERIASYRSLAKLVAERHGYEFDRRVSALNDRHVFRAGSDRNRIYLSLDKDHGAFEVCSHQGQHLGEYNFAGEQLEGADKSGGHDLKV